MKNITVLPQLTPGISQNLGFIETFTWKDNNSL